MIYDIMNKFKDFTAKRLCLDREILNLGFLCNCKCRGVVLNFLVVKNRLALRWFLTLKEDLNSIVWICIFVKNLHMLLCFRGKHCNFILLFQKSYRLLSLMNFCLKPLDVDCESIVKSVPEDKRDDAHNYTFNLTKKLLRSLCGAT